MALGLVGAIRWRLVYPLIAIVVMAVRVFLDMTGRHPNSALFAPLIGYAYFWFDVLPPFMLGGCAYLFRERIPRGGALLAAGLLAVIAVSHLGVDPIYRFVLAPTLFPPVLCYGIFYLAFDVRLPKIETSKNGDMSYGTYLYAFPIQQMLAASLTGVVIFPVYIALSIGLSLLAGFASWHLVEKHFHKPKSHVVAAEGKSLRATETRIG